ncbi:MAG: hypothetical protein FWD05_09445 [Oscillospiraceae bacterium]|nr:hypothetical protein [Oscillospiraceae bacterium]
MSNPDTIQTKQETVDTHTNAISRHSSHFNVTIPSVNGNPATSTAITDANDLAAKATQLVGRYAEILPRSANDIGFIATRLRYEDEANRELFTTG